MAELNFEKSITELENIVKKLESDSLTLDEMIKLFEKGIKLSAECNKMLDNAENKINILIKKENEIQKQAFNISEEKNEF